MIVWQSSEKNGKTINDTLWHKVKNMTFTNQLGKTVDLDSLKGKILVIDFFFSDAQPFVRVWQRA
jgi:cytochrome oxidase Cu insertion factor (SCO1/SenC/PrrC family)